jgi:molybdopterin-guanine dinucleotide biosynthesis protein A
MHDTEQAIHTAHHDSCHAASLRRRRGGLLFRGPARNFRRAHAPDRAGYLAQPPMTTEQRGGSERADITGLILAGGRGSRLGGRDKGLLALDGKPMVARVLTVLAPQVKRVVINANRHLEAYRVFGCEVVADAAGGYPGPLAGMAAGLAVASTPWLLSVPCDSPLLPADLATRMHRIALAQDADIAIPHDGDRAHPVFALIRVRLRDSLDDFLAGDERKILRWMDRHRLIEIDFSDCRESFINVNTPGEVAALEARLTSRPAGR